MLQVRLRGLICSLVLAGLTVAISPMAVKQPAFAQAPASPSLPPNSTQIVEQIVGRWELQLPDGKTSRTVIFAADGQLFDLGVFNLDPDTAVRFSWSIDFTQSQPQVVVNFGLGLLVGSPSRSEMQMRIFPLPLAENPQPNPEIIYARKLSADPSLPAGVTVVEAADAFRQRATIARQVATRTHVGAINRSQQANFIEHQQFFDTLQAIEQSLGLNLLSDHYDFQIVLSEEGRVANTLAIPRRNDLLAYVGRVTTRSQPGGAVTVSILCESTALTQTPPTLPSVTGGTLQCPDGYQMLN